MEKEFVPYELAVKLKALGFDEPCFSFYMGGFKELGKIKYVNPNNIAETNVLAPTFSQAFRWFREKYRFQHNVWSGKLNTVFYGYDILNIEEQEFVIDNSGDAGGDCDYDTYEEAELACLEKLIEIVESKSE